MYFDRGLETPDLYMMIADFPVFVQLSGNADDIQCLRIRPKINVARCPHIRIGIHQRICLSFQHTAMHTIFLQHQGREHGGILVGLPVSPFDKRTAAIPF